MRPRLRPPCRLESLEVRRFLSVSLLGGVLTISGSDRDDTLGVGQLDAATIRVQDIAGRVTFVADSAVNSIVINGFGGSDMLSLILGGDAVSEPGTVRGGNGNDRMFGGV